MVVLIMGMGSSLRTGISTQIGTICVLVSFRKEKGLNRNLNMDIDQQWEFTLTGHYYM
jgi:hypothetical protein